MNYHWQQRIPSEKLLKVAVRKMVRSVDVAQDKTLEQNLGAHNLGEHNLEGQDLGGQKVEEQPRKGTGSSASDKVDSGDDHCDVKKPC
jgi:hypothetical protein